MTRTLASWRDTVTSSWHCSTSPELFARITWFLCWILCFRGQAFRKKQSRHRDVYRDVMTGNHDVIMTLFNISGTICSNYVVFVLNPMFPGSSISKKAKPSSWRVPWRHDGTPWRHHDIVQHLRNYLPELRRFCVESYVFGVKDFEKDKAVIVTMYRDVMTWHRDVEQCRDDISVSRHDVTVHATMTALFFSRSLTPKT